MGASDSKLNLLLIGKAGNGKSSSGNAIVGETIFQAFGNMTSVTRRVKMCTRNRWKTELTVIDTPGLMDTWMNEFECCYFARNIMENALIVCKEGFHAILIVLNFTNRYSAEEQNVIKMLKEIFGPCFFQFVVLVFTHGDNFDQEANIKDAKDSQTKFLEWCKGVDGHLKSLLQACKYRAILFHNNPDYTGNKDVEVLALLKHAGSIKKLYTMSYFEAARKSREHLILTFCLDFLKKKICQELESLKREFQLLTKQEKTLLSVANELLEDINSKGNKNLSSFREAIWDVEKNFKDTDTNKAKHELLTQADTKMKCPAIDKLQQFTRDIKTLLHPERSKLNLKRKIRELLQYVQVEAHGTKLLDDERTMVELFESDVVDYDKNRTITTEIE